MYAETAYSEEGERVIKMAPLTVGAGAVDLDRGKVKCPRLFLEVLRDRQSFSEGGSDQRR